jgi:capsular exopolysaccharide synthesis family protein
MSLIDQARQLARGGRPHEHADSDARPAPAPDVPGHDGDPPGPHDDCVETEPEPPLAFRPGANRAWPSPQAEHEEPLLDADGMGAGLPSVNFATRVVAHNETGRLPIEQYRKLAAVLHHEQSDTGLRVLMVASPMPGDGKTLTAVNLALTLSESYQRRVLLVDGDLRSPSIHRLFGVENVSGLDEGLRDDRERKLTLVEVSPQLTLLPAGRPDSDPMSVLTSSRMRTVLDEAREKFDWVIVDTPPLGLLPDAHLLARMVDGTVLVVAAGCTSYQSAARAAELLGRNRILGVVLNRVDESVFTREQSPRQYYGRLA